MLQVKISQRDLQWDAALRVPWNVAEAPDASPWHETFKAANDKGIDRLVEAVKADEAADIAHSAKQWVQWMLNNGGDQFELIISHFDQLFAAPGGRYGFDELIKEILPYQKGDPDLVRVTLEEFLDKVEKTMAQAENTKGKRWSDICRQLLEPLRSIRKHWYDHPRLKELIADIQLNSTMDESIPWVDAYTGETDILSSQDLTDAYSMKFPTLETASDQAERLALQSSEAFNSSWDEEEEWDDPFGDEKIPMWEEIQHDGDRHELDLDDIRIWKAMKDEAWQFVNNGGVDLNIGYYDDNDEKIDPPAAVDDPAEIKARFRASSIYKRMISFLKEMAQTGAEYQDLTPWVLPLCNAFLFGTVTEDWDDRDAKGRPYVDITFEEFDCVEFPTGEFKTLSEALEADEAYEPFDMVEDYGGWKVLPVYMKPVDEQSIQYAVEEFDAESLEKWLGDAPEAKSGVKAQQSREFLRAMLEQSLHGKNKTANRAGVQVNLALEAGWEAWRIALSPEGNIEYWKAYRTGLDEFSKQDFADEKERRQAYSQLLSRCLKAFNTYRKQEGIVSIVGDKLKLTSGRMIDWRTAAIKFRNKELRLDQRQEEKLIKALQSKGLLPQPA